MQHLCFCWHFLCPEIPEQRRRVVPWTNLNFTATFWQPCIQPAKRLILGGGGITARSHEGNLNICVFLFLKGAWHSWTIWKGGYIAKRVKIPTCIIIYIMIMSHGSQGANDRVSTGRRLSWLISLLIARLSLFGGLNWMGLCTNRLGFYIFYTDM